MTADKPDLDIEGELRRVGSIEQEHLANKGKLDLGPDGGGFENVTLDSPIESDDWSRIFRIFRLNADEFEVVDDTVRMSTWQQSKGREDGGRDLVQLYSYSARFRRKPKERLSDEEIAEHRKVVQRWRIDKPKPRSLSKGAPVAAVINLADIQGGKSEGGGVAATRQRLEDGLHNVWAWLARMEGEHNVTEVVLVNNGDPLEGCAGNYDAQLFTVELNQRGQVNFVLDVWQQYAKALLPAYPKAQFVSVLCNHGEMNRLGKAKNQTSDSDNWGGLLAETLRRILAERPEFDHVEWTIPHDNMNVYTEAAGVPLAFNHGHKIPGNDGALSFEKWLNGQVRGDERAHAAKVWVTAHRHHFAMWDLGSCVALQAPSLDGGSKWLTDMTGRYSRAGILAFLVGEHSPIGVSDWAFL